MKRSPVEINKIKLKYTRTERFWADYRQLQTGRLALPVKTPLPLNTPIILEFSIPYLKQVLILKGTVLETGDQAGSAWMQNPGTIQIGFNGSLGKAVDNFNNILMSYKQYRTLMEPAAPEKTGCKPPDQQTASRKARFHFSQGGALPMDRLQKMLAAEKISAGQFQADTAELVCDVRVNRRSYIRRILKLRSTADAMILVRLFRRILPELIEKADWSTVLCLARAVDQAAQTTVFFAASSDLPANPLEYVFKNHNKAIIRAYANADADQRKVIHDIAGRLDAAGIEIMAGVLPDCSEDSGRKDVISVMIKNADLARNWILAVLDAPDQNWYSKRTALTLLGYVAKKEEDIDRARKLADHEDPRIRNEALKVLIKVEAVGAEELIIAALSDSDDRVRRRAMSCLTRLSPISENIIKRLLAIISAGAPPEKNDALRHYRTIVQLIKALESAATAIANQAEVESIILSLVRKLTYRNRWLFRRLKNSIDPAHCDVLSAAIAALGKIGTGRSESFLERLADSKSPQAEPAQAAANHIKLRYIAMLSNTPAENGLSAIA